MTSTRARNLAVAGALAATVLAGGATMAAASGGTPSPTATVDQSGPGTQQGGPGTSRTDGTDTEGAQDTTKTGGAETDEPSYTGSVTAPGGGTDAEDNGADGSAPEADEAAALAPLATMDEAAARDAATAAVPGTTATPTLDDENGSVVWSVEVTQPDGSVVDVKVDAGNGTVLAQDTGETGDDED